jgi:hypothetical protein
MDSLKKEKLKEKFGTIMKKQEALGSVLLKKIKMDLQVQ